MPHASGDDLRLARPLARDASVAIWAPSSPIGGVYPRRLARAAQHLEDVGHRVVLSDSCHLRGGLFPAEPRLLAQELHSLVADPGVRAVISAVGGWTASHLLPFLDYDLIRHHAKVICGFSDISILLAAIHSCSRIVTFHGPAALPQWGEASPHPYSVDTFLSLARGLTSIPTRLSPAPEWTDEILAWDEMDDQPRARRPATPWRVLQQGKATGPLIGGCIRSLDLIAGTRYMPDLSGRLLFVEDDDSTPSRFAAHLNSLRQRGLLDGVAGLIVGRHSRPRAMANGYADMDAAVLHVVADLRVPIAADVDLGHTDPILTLPIGVRASLRCDGKGVTIDLLEPAVEAP